MPNTGAFSGSRDPPCASEWMCAKRNFPDTLQERSMRAEWGRNQTAWLPVAGLCRLASSFGAGLGVRRRRRLRSRHGPVQAWRCSRGRGSLWAMTVRPSRTPHLIVETTAVSARSAKPVRCRRRRGRGPREPGRQDRHAGEPSALTPHLAVTREGLIDPTSCCKGKVLGSRRGR